MQWHNYREKHDNKLLFQMHIYECTNKGTQTQEKQNILQYEIQKKSHNNNTKKQDYILLLFALFI